MKKTLLKIYHRNKNIVLFDGDCLFCINGDILLDNDYLNPFMFAHPYPKKGKNAYEKTTLAQT